MGVPGKRKSESFPVLESARLAIRIGVAASAPASQSGSASPPNSIAARRPPVVFGGLSHKTRRYKGKTPIRRAYGSRKILRNVFSTPISLVNLHFFVLASSWKCQSELTSPAVVFGFTGKMGIREVFSLLESVGIKLGSGSLPRFLGDKGVGSQPTPFASRRPQTGSAG